MTKGLIYSEATEKPQTAYAGRERRRKGIGILMGWSVRWRRNGRMGIVHKDKFLSEKEECC